MTKRQVFFSFEYKKDVWRAGEVRNMGIVDNSSTFSDNDWEQVRKRTDESIKRWINEEMEKRSCVIVLIGETTSTRPWIKYEIQQAYTHNKGLLGVRIDWLKNENKEYCVAGENPFDLINDYKGDPLSKNVVCFDPSIINGPNAYNVIKDKLPSLIEDAITKAGCY